MNRQYFDKDNKFVEIFNPENGFYLRSGIINENGVDTNIDSFMRNYPNLIDVGIMGYCENGYKGHCISSGTQCYQNGLYLKKKNMLLDDYKRIVDESKNKVFSFALGGRGDPNKHENFEEILKYTRENNVIPNYTTSGYNLDEKEVLLTKEYCGAVAVSWYRQNHTINAIDKFLSYNMKTNIHYILSNSSIDEAIWLLNNNLFPKKINAIIFILHKPVGLGKKENILQPNDNRVKEFFNIIDNWKGIQKIGFDSCTIPGIINYTKNISKESIDFCEGARYSMYITSDMKAVPCSFDQDLKWAIDLNENSIQEAWDSEKFNNFRKILRKACVSCSDRKYCWGGCPITPEITLCNNKEK